MGGMNKQRVMRAVALGGALMALWGSAIGATGDAGSFLKMCDAAVRPPTPATAQAATFQMGYCVGSIDATFASLVIEAAEARRPDTGVCPKGDSGDSLMLVSVVVAYLKGNPQMHSQPSEIAVRAALRRAFPCR